MYYCKCWTMAELPIPQGRTVDFKNTVLILTSNIGSSYLLEGIDENGEISEEARKAVLDQLRVFRPEFLNRLDETILFKPLRPQDITGIIDILLAELNERLAEKEFACIFDSMLPKRLLQSRHIIHHLVHVR